MWNLLLYPVCPDIHHPVCPDIQKGIALFERLKGVSTLPSEKESIKIMIMSMED
jgi:hypothetical protein